jgi:hypothetical protein
LVQIDSIILRYTVGLPYLWIYYTWFWSNMAKIKKYINKTSKTKILNSHIP